MNTRRRSVPAFLVVLLAGAGGCDAIVDRVQDELTRPPGAGPTTPTPLPPPLPPDPMVDPARQSCRSTSECRAGFTCSVEWGVCLSPPGCSPEVPCPAICTGTCESQKPTPLPPPPPPPSCADTVVAGDETTCKGQDEWKYHAYEACRAQGLNLNDYSVGGGDCAPGKTNQVKYTCCRPTPPPSSPPPPSANPPPTACAGAAEGGPTSCKSVETWKQYATANCQGQGMTLTDFATHDPCGTGFYRGMKYSCCPPAIAR